MFSSSRNTLLRIPGIGPKLVHGILRKSSFREADQIIADCAKNNIQILHFQSKEYPKNLREIYDSPSILYIKGDPSSLHQHSIAIVGTRKASHYGRTVTRQVVESLAPTGTTVISGLAYGIDIEAHRCALEHNLSNHAVLASGLNVIYPKIHWRTAEEITKIGCLISENPPNTKPDAHLFPARNRIIAALADVTLVVEAAEKGGALITANIADSYNRPVFAVPGNLTNSVSAGCNNLIRQQKALIFTGVDDLNYHLNWDGEISQSKILNFEHLRLTREEHSILSSIQTSSSGLAIDEIAWKTQVPLTSLASILLSMEFAGLIQSLPGNKYKLDRVKVAAA